MMILNDSQYYGSKVALNDFKDALEHTLEKCTSDDCLKELEITGIKNQIEKLEGEINEYDKLKSGKCNFRSHYSISELKIILPQIRIASGMTQENIAESIKIDNRKFRQFENSNFYGATRATIQKIASILKIKVTELPCANRNKKLNS